MNELYRTLQMLKRDLDSFGLRWALVGGLAVSARAVSRYTGDVDVAVAVESDIVAERIAFGFRSKGYEVLAQIENEAASRLGTIRLAAPARVKSGLIIDFLFATAGIESEAALSATAVRVMSGLTLPVASLSSLIVFKLISESTSRPQDAGDLLALIRAASDADLEEARELATLATERGFHRNRDLHASLGGFIALEAEASGP